MTGNVLSGTLSFHTTTRTSLLHVQMAAKLTIRVDYFLLVDYFTSQLLVDYRLVDRSLIYVGEQRHCDGFNIQSSGRRRTNE